MTAARVELGAPARLSNLFSPPTPRTPLLLSFGTSSLICIYLPVWSTPSCSRQWRFVASRWRPSIVFRRDSKLCLPCRELTSLFVVTVTYGCFSAPLCPDVKKMIRYTFRTGTAGEYQYVFTECFPIRRCTYGKQRRDFVFGKSLDIHASEQLQCCLVTLCLFLRLIESVNI